MSVTQINLWTCDLCGKHVAQTERTGPWSDPVVEPPVGWDAMLNVPLEHRIHQVMNVCHACPDCVTNPDWDNYREPYG